MDELKGVQEASDKEHKQLGDQSEAYAKQLKEEALFATPPAEHVLDPDTAHASLLYHIASKEVISTGTMDHLRVKAADLDKRWQDIHGIDAVRQGLEALLASDPMPLTLLIKGAECNRDFAKSRPLSTRLKSFKTGSRRQV